MTSLSLTCLVLVVFLSSLVSSGSIGGRREDITIHADGGYDFLLAIHKDVPEDQELINKLQEYIQGASRLLLTATEGRMYFRNVTILIPKTWSDSPQWTGVQGRSFSKARVLIEGSSESSYVKPIYTLQPGGCGQEGDFIHISPNYVKQFDLLPQLFQQHDYYRHYGFDPFSSGDFDFADATLTTPEYSLALILYLSTLEHQYKIYPGEVEAGKSIQRILWSHLMTKTMTKEISQQISDRYEVWMVTKQPAHSNFTLLDQRLTRLNEYTAGRNASTSFNITFDLISELTNQTASECIQRLYSSQDFVRCEISPREFPPQSLIEQLIVNSDKIYTTSAKDGRCANLLRSASTFFTSCILEGAGVASEDYQSLVRQTVDKVKVTLGVNQTQFDGFYAKQFDKEYSRVVYGAKEKRLVREWAHLRWGLFDEDAQDNDPDFYASGSVLRPTGCPLSVKGTLRDSYDPNSGCTIDTDTGLPEHCVFDIDESVHSTVASLMYAEYLPSVTKFCTSETSGAGNEYRAHDTESPNQQNKRCDQMSTWDMMSRHTDFAVERGVKSRAPNTVFTLVKDKPVTESASYTVCLSLDVSGSMGGDRLLNLGTTVRQFITNYVRNGSYVGIVEFESTASTKAQMTQVTSQRERDILLNAVPTIASGGTGIGAGLQLCQQMLRTLTNNKSAGSYILLLSDGQENQDPYVSDVMPSIIQDGIIVNSIAYSQNAETVMANASAATGGQSFFAPDNDAIIGITSALISTVKAAEDKDEAIVTISSQKLTLNPSTPNLTQSVNVDETIKDTLLTFVYDEDINVNVTVKDETAINSKRIIPVTKKAAIKTITADLKGTAKGEIEYTIQSVDPTSSPDIAVTITSQPVENEEPIVIDAKSDIDSIAYTPKAQVSFYATIMKGVVPVSGMGVTATVTGPSGVSVKVKLLDNGAGGDSTKGDGIYSGVLNANQLDGNGYYSWKVDASGSPLLRNVSSTKGNNDELQWKNLTAITRSIAGGSLQVTNFVGTTEDVIAPEPVRDLKLLTAVEGVLAVGWTAPGDDPGQGIATGYQIAVSTDQGESVEVSNLEHSYWVWTSGSQLETEAGGPVQLKLNTTDLLNDFLEKQTENSTIMEEKETEDSRDITYFIRLRAFDERNNTGVWSNIISASFLKPEAFVDPIKLDGEKTYELISPQATQKETIFEALARKDQQIANPETTSVPKADPEAYLSDGMTILGGSIASVIILFIIGAAIPPLYRFHSQRKNSFRLSRAAYV